MGMNDNFYTPDQLAKKLHVSAKTIRNMIKDKLLRATTWGKGKKKPRLRIHDSELIRYMNEQSISQEAGK